MWPSAVPDLKNKYRDFLQLFSYVINSGDVNDSSFGDLLTRFCTDKLNNEVYASVMKLYPDVSSMLKGPVEGGIQALSPLFPGQKGAGSIYMHNRFQ